MSTKSRPVSMEAGQRLLLKPSKAYRLILQSSFLTMRCRREAGVDEISAGLYGGWPKAAAEAK